MQFYNHGHDGYIWEPLYRRRVALTPCEQEVIQNPAIRRLQRIAHYGASAFILPMTHTRYTHTLGVFCLVTHFCPTDYALRLAALLHDVGHVPFSHSVERAMGLDHHRLAARVIAESGLGEIVERHGFDPAQIMELAGGVPANPLATCGGLSLDHLDSWLRDSQTGGFGATAPHDLLGRLRLNGNSVEAADAEAALDLARRIATDHTLFLQPNALALDALVGEIFRRASPPVEELLSMGDEQALGRAAAKEPGLVQILRERPWEVMARPDDGGPGILVSVTKLYLGQPLWNGQPVPEVLPEAGRWYAALAELQRSYRVTWPAFGQ